MNECNERKLDLQIVWRIGKLGTKSFSPGVANVDKFQLVCLLLCIQSPRNAYIFCFLANHIIGIIQELNIDAKKPPQFSPIIDMTMRAEHVLDMCNQ